MPTKEDKLGALWARRTQQGETYYTGEVNGQKVVVFGNRYKQGDKQPDLVIYKSRPKGDAPAKSEDDCPF